MGTTKATAACSTCRHRYVTHSGSLFMYCDALGRRNATEARASVCQGSLWEPRPPGLLARIGNLITSWARIGDAVAERVRGRKPS